MQFTKSRCSENNPGKINNNSVRILLNLLDILKL